MKTIDTSNSVPRAPASSSPKRRRAAEILFEWAAPNAFMPPIGISHHSKWQMMSIVVMRLYPSLKYRPLNFCRAFDDPRRIISNGSTIRGHGFQDRAEVYREPFGDDVFA